MSAEISVLRAKASEKQKLRDEFLERAGDLCSRHMLKLGENATRGNRLARRSHITKSGQVILGGVSTAECYRT